MIESPKSNNYRERRKCARAHHYWDRGRDGYEKFRVTDQLTIQTNHQPSHSRPCASTHLIFAMNSLAKVLMASSTWNCVLASARVSRRWNCVLASARVSQRLRQANTCGMTDIHQWLYGDTIGGKKVFSFACFKKILKNKNDIESGYLKCAQSRQTFGILFAFLCAHVHLPSKWWIIASVLIAFLKFLECLTVHGYPF